MVPGRSTSNTAPMRIAVLDDYQRRAEQFADWNSLGADVVVSFFHAPIERAELATTLEDFEALVLMRERTAFPRSVLEQLPRLELLVTTGMRNAAVDVDYLSDRGVVVCGTGLSGGSQAPGVPSTVEVAWALIFATFKRVTIEDRALRAGVWQLDLPRNLAGATLGLAGLGRLGGAMVGPARAFGMEVIGWSENLTETRTAELGVTKVSKDELLERADVLSIHLVLSDRTRGLFGAGDLALMKSSAVLINTSRGPIVDERARSKRCGRRRSPPPGWTSTNASLCPPTTSCSRSKTPCCSRTSDTSARPRCARCTPRWSKTSRRSWAVRRSGC